MLKLFYSPLQNVSTNTLSYSPSAGKPELFVEHLKKRYNDLVIEDFEAVTRDDLKMVHSPHYVDDVLDLVDNNGFGNKSPDVAEALPYVAGSMVAATLHALKENTIAISPTSGAHHAGYSFGGGFCTFNFLALAAVKSHKAGAKKVGIIDLDYHYGNGTADIITRLDLDFIKHYSYGFQNIGKKNAKSWLAGLSDVVLGFNDCDLVIYNAGVDSHINDPLGGDLTTEQIKERDTTVLTILRQLKIPVAVSLAGGYQKDKQGGISAVLELHTLMYQIASELATR